MANREKRRARKQAARAQKIRSQKARQKSGSRILPTEVTGESLGRAMSTAVDLHHEGRLAEASHLYRQVLALQPAHLDALNGLAMIEFAQKRYGRAATILKKVIAMKGDNPGYHMNLGAVLDAAGELDPAAKSYSRAIGLAPTYADPYYNLGDLHLREGRVAEAIAVFDACVAAIGREFHALAYKAHALDDAGRHEEARYLLNFDDYVKRYTFDPPDGYDSIEDFNTAFARHIETHPTLQANVMSTEHGKHTGELSREPTGPMAAMKQRIQEAIRWYIRGLPEDPEHPAVKWAPQAWKLTSWGVVMFDRGHERAHIHPNGWLSGVFYLKLPDVIDDPGMEHQGWLEFGRPTPDLHVRSEPKLRHYKPAYGQMFLFPSYFYHGTIPFRSTQRRVCVAFDVEPLA